MPAPDLRKIDPLNLYRTLQTLTSLGVLARASLHAYNCWLTSPLLNLCFQQHEITFNNARFRSHATSRDHQSPTPSSSISTNTSPRSQASSSSGSSISRPDTPTPQVDLMRTTQRYRATSQAQNKNKGQGKGKWISPRTYQTSMGELRTLTSAPAPPPLQRIPTDGALSLERVPDPPQLKRTNNFYEIGSGTERARCSDCLAYKDVCFCAVYDIMSPRPRNMCHMHEPPIVMLDGRCQMCEVADFVLDCTDDE